jgi:hypothetical protein
MEAVKAGFKQPVFLSTSNKEPSAPVAFFRKQDASLALPDRDRPTLPFVEVRRIRVGLRN